MIESARSKVLDQVLRREQEFHDALSANLAGQILPPRTPDEFENLLLGRAGNIAGLSVLELGCGVGDLTLQLLSRGAHVTALDLSDGMVAVTRRRVERFAPGPVELVVAPVEHSGLDSASFDLVIGKWILHHADLGLAATEIRRLLKTGRRAIFLENSGLNPLLAFSRRFLAGRWGIPRYGTDDEHPLTRHDLELLRQRFARLAVDYPDLFFFQLFDRQVLRYRHQRTGKLLRGIDLALARTPLRRYSYHVILEMGS